VQYIQRCTSLVARNAPSATACPAAAPPTRLNKPRAAVSRRSRIQARPSRRGAACQPPRWRRAARPNRSGSRRAERVVLHVGRQAHLQRRIILDVGPLEELDHGAAGAAPRHLVEELEPRPLAERLGAESPRSAASSASR
jgi:hypothetical protein